MPELSQVSVLSFVCERSWARLGALANPDRAEPLQAAPPHRLVEAVICEPVCWVGLCACARGVWRAPMLTSAAGYACGGIRRSCSEYGLACSWCQLQWRRVPRPRPPCAPQTTRRAAPPRARLSAQPPRPARTGHAARAWLQRTARGDKPRAISHARAGATCLSSLAAAQMTSISPTWTGAPDRV